MATPINKAALLKDERVLKEIDRFKWIESEKAGHDIGIQKAMQWWIKNHAADWVKHHETKTKKK